MLLKIAQAVNEQVTFIPGFMATCCYSKPLLAVLKVYKASPIVRTSKNEAVLESIRDSGGTAG